MIHFRTEDPALMPRYMTSVSAGADLFAAEDGFVAPQTVEKVRTGVWIEGVDWDVVPKGMIPEVQIRCRSSLALKHQIMLANGVGTIDADYREEICVLLFNASPDKPYYYKKGDRVAQCVVAYSQRVPQFAVNPETRQGGFGSTNREAGLN